MPTSKLLVGKRSKKARRPVPWIIAAVIAQMRGSSAASSQSVRPKVSEKVGVCASGTAPVSGSKQPMPWKTSGLASAGA